MLHEAIERSLVTFNTHPYMSGPIIGALIRAEEDTLKGGVPPDRIMRFRGAMNSAFAAIGDAFFWNAMLPAAAVAGLFWSFDRSLTGVFIFLALFNLVHLGLRFWGFKKGLEKGLEVFKSLDRLQLPVLALRLRMLTATMLGGLTAWALHKTADTQLELEQALWAGLVIGPLIFGVSRLIKRRWPIEMILYGLLIVVSAWEFIMA